MIRILYDHEFFNIFGYSGASRYFHELIRRVAVAEGFRASVFMGFHPEGFGLIERDPARFERLFARRRPAIPKTARAFNRLNDFLFPLFARPARPDLLHQTYYRPCLPGFRGKRVVTVHDMTYELMPGLFPAGDPYAREKARAVERADGIVAISESTKRDLMAILKVPEDKIRVVHHGNSLTADPGPEPRLREPYLLYVGQRAPHKNFGTLLEAYGGTPGVHRALRLHCFGGGPFTEAELAAARRLGVDSRLSQSSGPDEVLANLYRFARALVYPSRYEGFGFPVLEAMGYGCPVILSDTSSLPEVAGEAGAYFRPDDRAALAKLLEKVADDEAWREELSRKAKVQAARFSWERCAAETTAFYRQVLGAWKG